MIQESIIKIFSSIAENIWNQESKKKLVNICVENVTLRDVAPSRMDHEDCMEYSLRIYDIESSHSHELSRDVGWISSNNYEINTLELAQLYGNDLLTVLNLLPGIKIRHLVISYSDFTFLDRQHVAILENLITNNFVAQTLILNYIKLDNWTKTRIAHAINYSDSISCLNLSITDDDDSIIHILDILKQCKNIRKIELELFKQSDIQKLTNFLVDNQTLVDLNIVFSFPLSEAKTQELFTVLEKNTSLESLCISRVIFDNDFSEKISTMLKTNFVLKNLKICNCYINDTCLKIMIPDLANIGYTIEGRYMGLKISRTPIRTKPALNK